MSFWDDFSKQVEKQLEDFQTLADEATAIETAKAIDLGSVDILGEYECHLSDTSGKNDWHYVTISKVNDTTLKWSNRADVSWTLTMTSDRTKLIVSSDCPYFKEQDHKQVTVVWEGDLVVGLYGPFNELYEKR